VVTLCIFLLFNVFTSRSEALNEDLKPERFRIFEDSADTRSLLNDLAEKDALDIYDVKEGQYIEVKASKSISQQLKKRFTVENFESEVCLLSFHAKTNFLNDL
jgi:soluble P-type ATPase